MNEECQEHGSEPKKVNKLCLVYAFGATTVLLCFLWIVWAVDRTLPVALYKIDEVENPESFIAENAWEHLNHLVEIGPKITGSNENEVLAIDYLERSLRDISLDCKIPMNFVTQVTSGSYYLDYKPYGSFNYYQNIRNIVVTLKGSKDADISPGVLINSHFDTMPESPGGSDAGIMIAVMLETIRVICKDYQPENSLVFLFNGAEETYFHGAHGYITDPARTQDVSVLVNLEGTGAGGKEVLFQAGPEQAWLMDYYEKVPHPMAQVAGEEVFQSGLIPSDTDFRIFRDFDDIIGYDMAYTRNGYRYHTKYDGILNLELGVFQHTGDNVLALVKALGNASEVRESKQSANKPTFYDFLGLFLIYYNKTGEIILNVVTILLSIGVAAKCYWDMKPEAHSSRLKHIGLILAAILSGWILSLAFMAAVAGILDLCNSSMSWYKNIWLIYGLYCAPTILSTMTSVEVLNRFTKYSELKNNAAIYIHMTRLIWTGVLFIGTCIGIRTVYFIVFPILFTSIAFLFIELFKLQKTKCKWIFVYLVSTIMPTMFTYYFGLQLILLFIPITGRSGDGVNPEFIIGLFCVLLTILATCYFIPFITYVDKSKYYACALGATFLIFFIMALTPFGFPYQADANDPRPQRYEIYHALRQYRDVDGLVTDRIAGFTFGVMDRNAPRTLEEHVSAMATRKSIDVDCDNVLYCGLPTMYASTWEQLLEEHVWIPAESHPVITNVITFEHLPPTINSPNNLTFNFVVKGANNFNIIVAGRENVNILRILPMDTLPEKVLNWKGRPVYFLLFVDGYNVNVFKKDGNYKDWENFEFSIEVENLTGEADDDFIALDVAVIGTYHDSKNDGRTAEYQAFLDDFPDWASVAPWHATFDSYIISSKTIRKETTIISVNYNETIV